MGKAGKKTSQSNKKHITLDFFRGYMKKIEKVKSYEQA